ncbi:divergent polysaccharide deacetylase family protein [Aliiroseovarius crassostreae]|uniref:divergent polysaccharide deacetylase family protein n=1 Tax=Aliiroseovarius crassostreae TaxID=154981 RepID=UPI0021FAB859|nr:divergent polysaccharide deacetylase family protein [Aliiroseovarius crassostreae]UWQ08893.1 divergent polysaccharide deacetylase family protein [Aliiroseovarius crassostreae]
MSRGFLSGVAMGAIVSGLGLAGLSLVMPMADAPVGPSAETEAPVAAPEVAPLTSSPATSSPVPSAPAGDDPAAMATGEVAGQNTDTSTDQPAAPDLSESAPDAPVSPDLSDGEHPVSEPAPEMAPEMALEGDEAPLSDGASEVPKPPEGMVPDGAPIAVPTGPAAQVEDAAPVVDAPPAGAETAPAPVSPKEDPAPDVVADTPIAGAGGLPVQTPALETDPPESLPDGDSDAPAPAEAPADEVPRDPEDAPMTDGQAEEAALSEDPSASDGPARIALSDNPSSPIGDLAPNVTTDRLPTIAAGEAPQDAPETVSEADAARAQSPLAIERNAIPFDRVGDDPIMAIILRDQGAERQALGELSSLPFPISIVIDATAADAEEAIAYYRAKGAEIVIEASLPEAATPTDAEVNFQIQKEVMEQGVAVLLPEESGFQDNTELANQVSEILLAGGFGAVSSPVGLSTGHRIALKAGVPSGLVFRDVDGAGQDGRAIRRFLDNAAFKARQQDGVIVLGRARPETLQALIEWSLGSRAKSVSLAPVSAVLLGE